MPKLSDRRDFLKKMALLGLLSTVGGGLTSCDSTELNLENPEGGTFQVWREMQQLLRKSADHLAQEYNRLKEIKDPEKMLEFVRDSIYLIPANKSSLRGMGTASIYGVRGALRDGFATPREKAEILNQLFSDSGIRSEVVFERTDFDEQKAKSFFFKPQNHKILEELTEGQVDRWINMLKLTESDLQELSFINPNEREAEKLANRLWDLLPDKEQIRFHDFDFRWDNSRSPAVKFTWQNQELVAHLFDPEVPFGQAYAKGKGVKNASPAEFVLGPVEFELTYRDNIYPEEEKLLLSKSYDAQDLVGRQLHLGFYHGLDLLEQASTTFNQVRIFTPELSLMGPEVSQDEINRLTQLGETITLEGHQIKIDEANQTIRVNGFPINWVEKSTRSKEVSELKVKITAGLPSLVKVEVWPTNKQGELVSGLMAGDFSFYENEIPVMPLMESNEIAPKLLILFDTSLSMPTDYRNEGMDSFLGQLETGIRQDFPKASITSWATDSSLYKWLRKACRTSFDLILFATDGDNKDDLKEEDLDAFRAGPPVIVLDVFNSTRASSREVFENLSVSSEGTIINSADQQNALNEIFKQIALIDLPPYVFTYYGSLLQEKNEVKLGLDANRITTKVDYQFKYREKAQAIGPKLIGIYLKIKIGSQSVNRVLAGWNPILDQVDSIGKKHADNVRNFVFGSLSIGIEGQGATFATALDELLEFRLRNQDYVEALEEKNLENTLKEIDKFIWAYDPSMIHLLAPLPDQVTTDSMTFASGPRIVLVKRTVGLDKDFSEDSVDILPTSNFVTISDFPAESFKINLKKTAHLALVENAFYEESTHSLLSNADLISADVARDQDWFKDQLRNSPHASYIREYWNRADGAHKIFGKELESLAYWQLDKTTGELLGILPDQTGGGKRKVYTQYDDLNTVIKAYTRKFNKNPGRSTSLLGYQLILLRLYAVASHAIKTMDTTNLEADVLRALQLDACEAANFIYGGISGRQEKIMGGLANLIRIMDKTSDDFPCK
ncbi:hypothetical protein ACPUEN_05860 [Algoriphagus yeomjeoni]|uniref:hypothetical protein n=1 Tax=Algoriphagus yeomjeoni TaxID=291403 RepID=UPI003CE45227